ncbi:hexosaminidase [Luteimonas cucumeris]|uniref:beta-N-acetylhexosaminidase n=2 Tax=Luteimonas cucumeris TaxID=985012 RepID=A0A562LEK0_9GAMM|nr:hexosaminidase [Luteimonas cucumeris]
MSKPAFSCRNVLLIVSLVLGGLPCAAAMPPATGHAAQSVALIPVPARLQRHEGSFVLDAGTKVFAEGDAARRVAAQFVDYVARTRGLELAIADPGDNAAGGIRFAVDRGRESTSPEAYALDVRTDGIRVTAADERGLFYGAVTLWQLLTQGQALPMKLPAVAIEDAPRFPWRGFMLDSARHFQSVDEIKQLLDQMALHKLNTFHWHLTDDQGWRVEIRKYPRLTGIGGCRIPAGDAGKDPATGAPRPYCGHYTQQQIRDVVRYAAQRHITIVPEFDVPGHAQAAVAAYPALGVPGITPAVSSDWGVNPWLFNVETGTLAFMEDVLTELMDLFPGTYLHLGGDEAVKGQWQASPRIQARMRELGIADEAALQSWMLKRLETFLETHGRRLIGWDEIIEGGLPPQAAVMSWRGTEGGLEAARLGHDVVMSPKSHLYFDFLQTGSTREPPGRPSPPLTLEKVYGFEPVPDALAAELRHHILGLQAHLWTEHTRSFARLQHNLFPRLTAVAETGWSARENRDYADFLRRLPTQLRRYDAMQLDYAKTPFEVIASVEGDRKAGSARLTLSNPLGYEIRYTTDGSAPTARSSRYQMPLDVRLPATLQATTFFDGKALAPAIAQRFDPDSLLRRSDDAMATCPDGGRLLLRLEDDGPADGTREFFNVTIFNPCWQWLRADLDGIAALDVRAGRIPYNFGLAGDEPNRKFRPATSAHGELEIRAGCDGELLAAVPLPAEPGADGFIDLRAQLPARVGGRQDLCIVFTGDTRPAMWVLDQARLVPGN